MDLAKLVTMLQSAKEGSEYLDYSIQRLFGTAKPVPLYTRSIDAALTLLPEGWTIHRLSQLSDCRGGFGGWIGEIYRASDAMIPYPSSAPAASAPLALCVAAMRVRLAEEQQRDELRRSAGDLGESRGQRSGT
ncbi:MAG TPA: hypothetical protein VE397_20810 [Stellaceae bacterium]|jgi:hypothetical protein|nr:hypothetical protein [Stellaceae bacterium]